MLRSTANSLLLKRIPQMQLVRVFSSTPISYAALEKKVRVRVVSNKKKGGKPSRGPGTHMTFKEMTTKLNFQKTAPAVDLTVLASNNLELNKLYLYSHLKELHHLGSFNKFQYNELWSSPFSVVRESTTLPICDFLLKSQDTSSLNNRMILLGETGVGKTTLISQFQSLAKNQGSIVLHFNDCAQLIDGSNDYIYDSHVKKYHQPMYLNKLFNKLKKGNLAEFTDLKLSKTYKIFQFSLSPKNNLVDLINLGKKLKGIQKFEVWELLISELKTQTQYPVHLTIDNFSAISNRPFTNYRDSEAQFIYFDQFTLGKFLIDHISGVESFNKGSVLIGTSGTIRQKKTLLVPLGLQEFDPYAKKNEFDSKLANYLSMNNGLQILQISKFDKQELKILLDQCLETEILKNDNLNDEQKILDGKYILSGNGNPREFYKSCVLNYY